ncbi:MAG TPA: glutamate mutase L, partial [Alphaproteobacteria bacterium]|nr:glutamate mutase L [Alphaproteobacteria bacterium]
VLMPTPAAVLEGARLLSQGTATRPGLGDLLVVDVGGATTDVHSICKGDPARAETVLYGLPEPFAKRTVEGDLGMRHNARTIVETCGADTLAREAGIAEGEIETMLAPILADVERLPANAREQAFDRALARAAIRLAVRRHAGTVETVYTATGPVVMQRGKDLSRVQTLIGTGGPIVHALDPAGILAAALADPAEPASLRPQAPRMLLDIEYLLYAVGLLAEAEPEAALALGLNHMRECATERVDGHFSAA